MAMKQLWLQTPVTDASPGFEASANGMFTLVNGLHCLVWNATIYGLNQQLNDVTVRHELRSLMERLQEDLSGPNIDLLTERAVAICDNGVLISAHQSLGRWQQAWDSKLLKERPDGHYKSHGFSSDPLPLWWIAKLFLLLHVCAAEIPDDSEFAILKASSDDPRRSMRRQARIFGWMSRIRQAQRSERPKKTPNDSIVDLMQPNMDCGEPI